MHVKNSTEKIAEATASIKFAKINLAEHPYLVYGNHKKQRKTMGCATNKLAVKVDPLEMRILCIEESIMRLNSQVSRLLMRIGVAEKNEILITSDMPK